MKKLFFLFIIISLCLTGCSSQNGTESIDINNPYEINVNGKILSYYDENTTITGFKTLKLSLENCQNEETNNIIVDKDNKIRCISIIDKNIVTYNKISVGDNISKIEDNFVYEDQIGNDYTVLFNGVTEENPTNQNKEENWILITYNTDGHQITRILISDVKFGREMR